ncbi:uncharacterized protein [Antedon mediterranea]|uniref:uncharacterized protein n=1 Tax=Antedon mediterranea TaxID=105859 RepID=UPI003AF77149
MQGRRNSSSVIGKAQELLKQSRRFSHVPTATTKTKASTDGGSELDAYLSQLSMKTSGTQVKKSKVEGLSDISLTTDEEDDPQPVLQNRFVKKSLSQTLVNTKNTGSSKQPTSENLNKTLPNYSSSALHKAAAFNAKYGTKKKSAIKTLEKDKSTIINSTDSDDNIEEQNLREPAEEIKPVKKLAKKKYLEKDKVRSSTPKKKDNKSSFHSIRNFNDSDDEMQAFIMNLSPVTSPDIPPIRKKQALKPKDVPNKVKENVDVNKSFLRDKKDSVKREKVMEKAPREIVKELSSLSLASSIHTIEDDDMIEEIKTERSVPSLNKFAYQTIDDLQLPSVEEFNTPCKNNYESDFETEATDKTISEIKTEDADSIEELVDTYTDSVKERKSYLSESISSSIGTQTPDKSKRKSEKSENRTKEQGSYGYTEDFDSYSKHSGTDSEVEELPNDSARSEIYTRSYTSYSETRTLTVTPRKMRRSQPRNPGIDVGTQVAEGDIRHQRNADSEIPGLAPSIVAGFMEPKLVTSHVISTEALEALTGYSPSILAMNDLLRAQLIGAQSAVQHMQYSHQQLVDSISQDYQYTTLEQTKQYIKMHKKSRLTMEDALKQVKEEMDEGYR